MEQKNASGPHFSDSPLIKTYEKSVFPRETEFSTIFASIHTFNSLNQGEGSVFRLRKYVFRIPRLKLPLKTSFLEKK